MKKRESKVKFAIGMIVSHPLKNEEEGNYVGMIIGWHWKRNSTFIDKF